MDSPVCKPSVPVHGTEKRDFRCLYPLRQTVQENVVVLSAPVVRNLEHEMLVRGELDHSHQSGLIDVYVIVEITEFPDLQCVQIPLIPCKRKELLACHKFEPVALMPCEIGIFYRRGEIVDRMRIAVFVE